MLDLKTFIAKTIAEIVDGVAEAQSAARAGRSSAVVVPSTIFGASVAKTGHGEFVTVVEFDVAVAETGGAETRGGIGVVTGIVNLGSAGQTTKGTEATTRVRFAIPVKLPGELDR